MRLINSLKKMSKTSKWLAIINVLLLVMLVLLATSIITNDPIKVRPKWMEEWGDLEPNYPATPIPDNIILAPGADFPRSVGVNWRTDASSSDGAVQYRQVSDADAEAEYMTVPAKLNRLTSVELLDDRNVHCFSATLEGLQADREYEYRVGSPGSDRWSPYFRFLTPPARGGFSFVHFGDTQNSASSFGYWLQNVDQRYPETSFYLISGDMVELGEMRDQWDDFFYYASPTFATVPVAMAMGNHDYVGGSLNGLKNIAAYFNQPKNGVTGDFDDHYYAFSCHRVRFIVMDSRESGNESLEWLENQLRIAAGPDYDFTVVMMHFPMYTARSRRRNDNLQAREAWRTLFDKYGADLVLTGHDHSYMRSKRLRNDMEVAETEPGTYYVIATAANKFYRSDPHEAAAVQFGDIKTYQVIEYKPGVDGGAPVLEYSAYDPMHRKVDSVTIPKQEKSAGK